MMQVPWIGEVEKIVENKKMYFMWMFLDDIIAECSDWIWHNQIKPRLNYWKQFPCNSWMPIDEMIGKWNKMKSHK